MIGGPATNTANVERLQNEITERMGVCPAFFLLAETSPEVMEHLWRQAKFAYLDNPLPPLFKEKLFVYLSRFCRVPYCLARHGAFLLGHGNVAGDPACRAIEENELLALLARPLPSAQEIESCLQMLPEATETRDDWFYGSDRETILLVCSTPLFMRDGPGTEPFFLPETVQRCREKLRRVLGPTLYAYLVILLSYIRSAHDWTQSHPDIAWEADVDRMLQERRSLANWINTYSNNVGDETADASGSQNLQSRESQTRLEADRADHRGIANQFLALSESRRREVEDEQRFRILFDDSPISLWEQDWSAAKRYLDDLRAAGCDDFAKYFTEHPDAVGDCMGRVKLTKSNKASIQLFEAASKDELLASLPRLIAPESRHVIASLLVALAEGRSAYSDEEYVVTLSGKRKCVLFFFQALPGSEQSLDRVLVSLVDITQLRAAEQKLNESEANFISLAESAPVSISIGRNANQVYANRWLEQLTGYSRQELLEIDPENIAQSDFRQQVSRMTSDCLRTGQIQRSEFKLLRKDGQHRWADLALRRIEYEGRPAVLATLVDNTERVQAEQALASSERQFRNLVETSHDLIWATDAEGRWTFVNRDGANAIYGRDPEEMIGRSLTDFETAAQAEIDLQVFAKVLGGEAVFQYETEHLRKDGSPLILRYNAIPLLDGDGQIVGAAGSAIDVTELKRSEQALRASEHRFRQIVDHAPEAVVLFDVEAGHFIMVNPAAERLLKMSAEELCRRGPAEISPPLQLDGSASSDKASDLIARVAAGETPHIEWIFRDANGQDIHSEVRLLGIEVDDRKVIRGSITDITERKRAEREVHLRDQAIATSIMPAVFGDANHVITHANQAFLDLLGFESLEQVVGMPNTRFESHPTSVAEINAAMNRDGSWTGEIVIRRMNGAAIELFVSATLIRDAQGSVAGTLATFVDVTDRNRAERALFQSESLFRCAFQDAATPTALQDADGTYLRVNGSFCDLVGRSEDELIGRSYREITVQEDLDLDARLDDQMFDGTIRFHKGQEKRYIHKEGHPVWVLVSASLVRDPGGRPLYRVVQAQDITDRHYAVEALRKREDELRELNASLEQRVAKRTRELEHANENLEAYARTVTHDLRAPGRAVEGFAQALAEDYGERLDDVGRDYIQRIARSARRMDVLIEDLLAYARLGRAELKLRHVSLKLVVAEALDQAHAEIAQSKAVVHVADDLPVVRANRAILLQIVTNLISNAIKFVAPDVRPEVNICVEEQETGLVRLWVEDNGIGVAEKNQQRIFRSFERLHGVETYRGTGIGLAIVARACKRLGGACGLESELGRGSRFWVELPAPRD